MNKKDYSSSLSLSVGENLPCTGHGGKEEEDSKENSNDQ